jgi:hypothetical protein
MMIKNDKISESALDTIIIIKSLSEGRASFQLSSSSEHVTMSRHIELKHGFRSRNVACSLSQAPSVLIS